jgi:hypothetical protein
VWADFHISGQSVLILGLCLVIIILGRRQAVRDRDLRRRRARDRWHHAYRQVIHLRNRGRAQGVRQIQQPSGLYVSIPDYGSHTGRAAGLRHRA